MEAMKETGPGVYLMPNWRALKPEPTRELLENIPRALAGKKQAKAASIVVAFSVAHGAWCGVKVHTLYKRIDALCASADERWDLKQAIERMVRRGLMEIPRKHTRWGFRWLNRFEPEIVCVTKVLRDKLQVLAAAPADAAV